MSTALVLVDLQNDFLPGGALAVPDGDAVLPIALRLLRSHDVVVATQDLHPSDHGSFASVQDQPPFSMGVLAGAPQVLWPDHCVQGTRGADFAEALDPGEFTAVFPKGTDRTVDSYSGFFDNHRRRTTGLGDWLREREVDHLVVLGLATDYCVKATVLDALDLGFGVTLVTDGCRAVEMNPGDGAAALAAMEAAGALLTTSHALHTQDANHSEDRCRPD